VSVGQRDPSSRASVIQRSSCGSLLHGSLAAAVSSARERMKRTHPRTELTILLILIGLFLWRGFLPAWKTLNTDFPNYYLGARLYRQGYSLDRVYDWTWLARQKDNLGIDRPIVGFTPYPLLSVLPVGPLSALAPLRAKRVWLIVNLLFMGLVVVLLNRISQIGLRRVMILTLLAMDPLCIHFLFGQMHILVLLLLSLAAWAYFTDRPAASGVLLAAATALKIYPALFLLYLIRKKQWRAVVGLLAGCIFFAALSLALFGWSANHTYLFEVLPRALSGTCIDPYSVRWNSLIALLRRMFIAEPDLNPHPIVHFPPAFALLQALCQALLFVPFLWLVESRRRDPEVDKLEWSGFLILLLILSTEPAQYHFCVLILPAVLIADYFAREGKMRALIAWTILYVLVCLPIYRWTPPRPSGWHIFLSFPRLYAALALWVFLFWEFNRACERPLILRIRSRETAAFGFIFVLLFGAGTASNFRNLKGQFKNYSGRVFTAPGNLMATEPNQGSGGVWFVSMSRTGYDLSFLQGSKLHPFSLGADAFQPAWSSAGRQVWVELSGRNSRIARIVLGEDRKFASSPIPEIENATRPAISRDGKWLAFIREDKGRGSLWVADLKAIKQGASSSLAAHEITATKDDVWDASFAPDNRILYSARPHGTLKLFSVDPVSLAVSPIFTRSSAPSRFPVESPDGKWLAFSREAGGAWHLALLNLQTGKYLQLTLGACNSTDPAWTGDSRAIIYATDCGRGLGLTALAKLLVPQ
jgi:hypothetical protein